MTMSARPPPLRLPPKTSPPRSGMPSAHKVSGFPEFHSTFAAPGVQFLETKSTQLAAPLFPGGSLMAEAVIQPEASTAPLSQGQRVVDVFIAPSKTFTDIL